MAYRRATIFIRTHRRSSAASHPTSAGGRGHNGARRARRPCERNPFGCGARTVMASRVQNNHGFAYHAKRDGVGDASCHSRCQVPAGVELAVGYEPQFKLQDTLKDLAHRMRGYLAEGSSGSLGLSGLHGCAAVTAAPSRQRPDQNPAAQRTSRHRGCRTRRRIRPWGFLVWAQR